MDSILCDSTQTTNPQNLCNPETVETSTTINQDAVIENPRKRKLPTLSSSTTGEDEEDEPRSKISRTPTSPWDLGGSFESKLIFRE